MDASSKAQAFASLRTLLGGEGESFAQKNGSRADAPLVVTQDSSIAEILNDAIASDRQAGSLHEVRCSLARDVGSAAGFILGLLARRHADERAARQGNAIVWITDPAAAADDGGLYPCGLEEWGLDPTAFTMVRPMRLTDALWTADEAARCNDLAAAILHVKGNPGALDMTATRRLMLRSRASGVLSIILRHSGEEEATAAATRWHVKPLVSDRPDNLARGLGQARLSVTLERNRNGRTGQWPIAWDHNHKRFEYAPQPSQAEDRLDRAAHAFDRPRRPGQMGSHMAHRWPLQRAG